MEITAKKLMRRETSEPFEIMKASINTGIFDEKGNELKGFTKKTIYPHEHKQRIATLQAQIDELQAELEACDE
jgi:hypothetical protein